MEIDVDGETFRINKEEVAKVIEALNHISRDLCMTTVLVDTLLKTDSKFSLTMRPLHDFP